MEGRADEDIRSSPFTAWCGVRIGEDIAVHIAHCEAKVCL